MSLVLLLIIRILIIIDINIYFCHLLMNPRLLMSQEVLPFIGVFLHLQGISLKHNNLTYFWSFIIRGATDICMAK